MNTGLVAELLVEAQVEFEQDERFTEFFRYHTLGLPLAFFLLTEAVTGLNPKGDEILQETWTDFCRILNVDPELEWTSIHEMLLGFMFDDDEDEDSE